MFDQFKLIKNGGNIYQNILLKIDFLNPFNLLVSWLILTIQNINFFQQMRNFSKNFSKPILIFQLFYQFIKLIIIYIHFNYINYNNIIIINNKYN